MFANKQQEDLEKIFLKTKEKDILARIDQGQDMQFYLSNLLGDEIFLKNAILNVIPLCLKYNKPFIFNEMWKRTSRIKNEEYRLEIYRDVLKKVIVECDKDSLFLKIVSNKIPFSLKQLKLDVLVNAFIAKKTDNLIFFFEKRRLKKHNDLMENQSDLLHLAYFYKDFEILRYFKKRELQIFGEDFLYLKKAVINGSVDLLNILYFIEPISYNAVIDWRHEPECPDESSEKWLNSVLMKNKLSQKLKIKKIKSVVNKI